MNKENIFYVYLHRRATDNKVFYVGKGKNKRAWNTYYRNKFWKRTYDKHGLIVEVVFEDLTEEEAFQVEIDTILEMRYFNHPLCNMSNGGEGASGVRQSVETRLKRSESLKGRKVSLETRLKIAKSNSGKKKTQEQVEAMRLTSKGVKQSEETINKRVQKLLGKRRTAEHRQNMSDLAKIRIKDTNFVKHGDSNASADRNIYTFLNTKTSEIFIGTRLELCAKFNIKRQAISNLFSKTRNVKTAKDWTLLKE